MGERVEVARGPPGIRGQRLRGMLSQDIRSQGLVLNPGCPEYEAGATRETVS